MPAQNWLDREALRAHIGHEVTVLAIYGRRRRFTVAVSPDGDLLEVSSANPKGLTSESEYATIERTKENQTTERQAPCPCRGLVRCHICKEHITHKQQIAKVKPTVTCASWHITFGGLCLNCGWKP